NQQIIAITARRLGIPALRDADQLLHDRKMLEQQLHQAIPELLKQDQQLQKNIQSAQQVINALRHTSIALAQPKFADKNLLKTTQQIIDNSVLIDFHGLLNRDWIDLSPL